MKTRITELFGIKHPIVLAGMNWATTPKLVSAVCNAGGLGILAIGHYTPEEARKDIRKIKTLTDKPFGVNQTLVHPGAKAKIDVAIEENGRVLYASAYQRRRRAWGFIGLGPHSGLYRSLDGGNTWDKLSKGLPEGDTGRIGIEISKSHPKAR